MECAAEIVDFSKTYHHPFLLKSLNVEDSCDLVYKQIFRSIMVFFNGSSKTSQSARNLMNLFDEKTFYKIE